MDSASCVSYFTLLYVRCDVMNQTSISCERECDKTAFKVLHVGGTHEVNIRSAKIEIIRETCDFYCILTDL